MARLAEELVEEWLNRQGYFTIRGLKMGTAEMDLLAIKPVGPSIECRHLEVQASTNPISYICSLPKPLQKSTGMGPKSAKKRTPEQVVASVDGWIDTKYRGKGKTDVKMSLCASKWSEELVVGVVKFPDELQAIEARGIRILQLANIVRELVNPKAPGFVATGADFVNLIFRPTAEGASR